MTTLPAPPMPAWLEAMLPPDIQRYCVDVGGYRMHVMERGRGRPVLMLHGNPTWGFLYRKVAAALTGEPLRLIMPDLIGLGFSDKPATMDEHQLDQHGHWMGQLIDELDLAELIFVGQDWGGPIGLHALHERAQRVAGMVILNTVVGPPKSGFRPTLFHRFSRLPVISDVAFRLGGFPQNLLTLAQGNRRSMLGEVGRAYRYPLRHVRDRIAPLALARMVPDSHQHPSIPALQECEELVRAYQEPAAIVWGERDPVLARVLGRIEALFPQAPVTRTQAGHYLQEEVPDEIAAAIRMVAAQIDAAGAN
jgi:pimeloyl-ACP methyl ester carboxylesterase